jgi:mono/diheme cytochrome c family protein
VPQRAPDAAAGEPSFIEKCAPCHGESGDGQGPQAAALPNPPAALSDFAVAQRAVPEEWYAIVTEGRIESFMPGFASLDDDQRWDVVGYALSLGLPAQQVDAGRVLFQESCVQCHGERGEGVGDVQNLASPDFFAGRSLLALYGAITGGVGTQMPAYADDLTDDERWALAAYVRSLALGEPSEAVTATPTSAAATAEGATPTAGQETPASEPARTTTVTAATVSAGAQITGRATNGTAGGSAPDNLEVTLHGFDGDQEALTLSQPIDAGGNFAFDGIEPTVGRSYVVTADYQDVLYASEIGEFPAGSTELELPLTVFEASADTGGVEVSRLHLLFDFPAEDVVQVVELWLLSNLGDRTVYDGQTGAIEVALPEGASGLSLDGGSVGDRFELTESGFRDRHELVPGENTGELVFSYILPYDGSLELARRVAYPVAATVAMVSGDGPQVIGDGFTDMGVRQVSGAALHTYERIAAQAGDEIALTLRGRPESGGAGSTAVMPIVFGVAALALALVGVGLIWYRPRRAGGRESIAAPAPDQAVGEADRTLWAIASLDNEFAAGKVDAETYHARRAELVRRAQAAARD